MPLSSSVMINKDEVLELLDEALDRLPEELRAARWLLKEREEFLAKIRREGDDILEQARARAERMVQRTEVVKAAEQRARQIVERAEAEARRMRHEGEDYCDQKLASFEIVLERTLKMVAAGRAKLQGSPLSGETPVVADASAQPEPDRRRATSAPRSSTRTTSDDAARAWPFVVGVADLLRSPGHARRDHGRRRCWTACDRCRRRGARGRRGRRRRSPSRR